MTLDEALAALARECPKGYAAEAHTSYFTHYVAPDGRVYCQIPKTKPPAGSVKTDAQKAAEAARKGG